MTESKQDQPENEKKSKQTKPAKATTGAWWKSALLTDDQEQQQSQPGEQDPTTAPAAKEKAAPKKPSRGRRPARKSGKKTTSPTLSTDQRADPDASQPLTETAVPVPPAATAVPVEPSDTSDQRPAIPGGEGEQSDQPHEERRSKRSRGRRGGRRKSGRQKKEQEVGERSEMLDEDQEQPEQSEPDAGRQGAGNKRSEEPPGAGRPDKAGAVKEAAGKEHKPVVKLLINADEPEECRLALLEDGRLESLYVSSVSRVQTRNNIYKARVVAIESNLQAAFVDYGTEKNGFLTFSEIHPEYYRQNLSAEVRALVEQQQWKKLSISDVMEKGQEMLVQVVKEEVGKKGANLTTYLSLPGRCVVLMPGSESEGVSRKISGEERRNELREIMNSLQIPEGIGWIVRTASVDITKTALSRDVRYLLRLWREIKEKGQKMDGVGLLYQDHNCVMRFLREHFDPDIQEILVDDEAALEKVSEFVEMLPAKQRTVKVKLHKGARPVFNHYSVEDQIESIYQPRVSLPGGGSIVIEPTEAMVSIDVNSGSTGKGQNFEETIFQANMEAATELARQLRLRDLGGLIVVDFIDMRSSKHIREVEKQVKNAMRRDKAKVDITRISRFGLLQISRQKLGSPIESGNYRICEHCRGRGTVRSVETQALFYLRRIHTGASRKQVVRVNCRFPLDIAQYLLNNKRQDIMELEEHYETKVIITGDPAMKPLEHEIAFEKAEKEEGAKKQA
jgi:ribonuclease E